MPPIHSQPWMLRFIDYGEVCLAAWIVIQIVTGKFMGGPRTLRRQNNPSAYWVAIALQALVLIIIGLITNSEITAAALVIIMAMVPLGGFVYGIFVFVTNFGMFVEQARENPKEFWGELFFGRTRKW